MDYEKSRLVARLGEYTPDVEDALAHLQKREIVDRIWRRDHKVWKPDPTEIDNRLGWLTVTDTMREQVSELEEFAQEARDAGYKHVVLLGMGGGSLGPEVLRQTFGSSPGYPQLIVLDSTVPSSVQAVHEAIDPACTLFLVSSKSGSTTEPNVFYAYFRQLVEKSVGEDRAGQNFVAITDPGTSLAKLAQGNGFWRIFLNPPDIGGRYSVLSYFGLVPAALIGVDVNNLLDRADRMRESSASCVPVNENPSAWLGTVMGVLAKRGRDKLTVITSPAIVSFGLWAEQLIAESTGKEGNGLVPIAGEPLADPQEYGDDRLFVYLRLDRDANTTIDAAIKSIEDSGHPVVRLGLSDKYDLGGEFFRWELATAIAGEALEINPFDQPNVQAAKDMTESVLTQFESTGNLPKMEDQGSPERLLAESRQGDYLAIMVYLRQTPDLDRAMDLLRRNVTKRHGIATTMGYGPRFLHSTGQLHKGGPDSGLFLQLTADHIRDLSIPGERFSFGVLADAQAVADLRALRNSNRRVARVHLGSDAAAVVEQMARELASA